MRAWPLLKPLAGILMLCWTGCSERGAAPAPASPPRYGTDVQGTDAIDPEDLADLKELGYVR